MRAFLASIALILAWLVFCLLAFPPQVKSEPVNIGWCSAVYLDKGYILTAGHCAIKNNIIVKRHKTDEVGWTATLQVANPTIDFAIYRLDVLSEIPFTKTKLACYEPKMRQHFIIKGWPDDLGYTEVIGYVAGPVSEQPPWSAVQVVIAPIFYGSSGSGAYDVNDEVVGIMVGALVPTSLALMVPASEICKALPVLK